MYKVHYLCKMESELKIIKAKREEKIKELKQKKKMIQLLKLMIKN